MMSLLGQASDRDVAAELGLGISTVSHKRQFLGIPAFQSNRPRQSRFWTPARLALLGRVNDGELARRWGISRSAVFYRRQLLGIPPAQPAAPRVRWTAKMRRLLGWLPDTEVAREFGIGVASVLEERRRLGIPRAQFALAEVVPSSALRRLLARPIPEVINATGLSQYAVQSLRRKLRVQALRRLTRWTPDMISRLRRRLRLGSASDRELAEELGVPAAALTKKRHVLRILRQKTPRPWTPEEDALLRHLAPREVADRTGRSLEGVYLRRQKLGIKRPRSKPRKRSS